MLKYFISSYFLTLYFPSFFITWCFTPHAFFFFFNWHFKRTYTHTEVCPLGWITWAEVVVQPHTHTAHPYGALLSAELYWFDPFPWVFKGSIWRWAPSVRSRVAHNAMRHTISLLLSQYWQAMWAWIMRKIEGRERGTNSKRDRV